MSVFKELNERQLFNQFAEIVVERAINRGGTVIYRLCVGPNYQGGLDEAYIFNYRSLWSVSRFGYIGL